jgi:hypothetical protein
MSIPDGQRRVYAKTIEFVYGVTMSVDRHHPVPFDHREE